MKGVVALLVVIAAAMAAPLAAADRAPAPVAEPETEEVVVYDIDRNGKQIGPKVKLSREEREAHRVRDRAAPSFLASHTARRSLGRASRPSLRDPLVAHVAVPPSPRRAPPVGSCSR